MKKIIPFISLVLGVIFILSVYFFLKKDKEPFSPEFSNVHIFNSFKAVKPFELKDESKALVNNSDLLNKWTIINFGYTSCPDICPTNLADASIMIRILNEDMGINDQIQSWFISLDPERDTHEIIGQYTNAFHPELTGLSASNIEINALALAFGFSYQIQAPIDDINNDIYWVAHSDMMILINPQGQYAGYISPPYNSQNMALALSSLIKD